MPTSDTPLDSQLDRLVESYRSDDPLSSLATHALPNRRRVIEAFHHLQHLVFLGFFTTRALTRATLREALAEHLEVARDLLVGQIGRACAWRDRDLSDPRCAEWCASVVDDLLDALPELREQLGEDVRAAYANDPAAESLEEVVYSYPGIHALTAYRIAHRLFRADVPLIPRILTEHAHNRTGIDIHPGARIGRRFFIDHGTGVVIGATTVIGDDVRLYQGVTLGAQAVDPTVPRGRRIAQRHPTLQDRVTVYAGATILGADTVIGHDSVIGGNVWLTASVPPHSRVLFTPEPA